MAYQSSDLASANLNIGGGPSPISYGGAPVTAGQDTKPQENPVANLAAQGAQASPYGQVYSPESPTSGYTDPAAFQTVINQMQTKMQSNNKLINAKNAAFKGMYDQDLTDEEKASLTPELQHAFSSGNRNMIDAALSGINAQIKGYDETISSKLQAYSTAVSNSNQLKLDAQKTAMDYLTKGAPASAVAGLMSNMGVDPSTLGFTHSISIPQGTLAATNNNPGNLKFVGQPGATEGAGGFAHFETPEAGYAALQQQIKLDASRGQTLAQFINKYAPSSENNTSLYIQQAQQALGISADSLLSSVDVSKVAQFIAKKESGSTAEWALPGGAGGEGEAAGITQSGDPSIDSQSPGYYSSLVSGSGGLTQSAIDMAAQYMIAHGGSLPPGYSRSTTGPGLMKANAVSARAAQLSQGNDISLNAANIPALKKQIDYANTMQRSVNTADDNLQIVMEGANKVNKNDSPLINEWSNMVKAKAIGSGDLNAYQTAIQTVRSEYATILSRGGVTTDSMRKEAMTLIPDNITKSQLQQVVDVIKREGENVVRNANDQINQIKKGMSSSSNSNSSNDPMGIL